MKEYIDKMEGENEMIAIKGMEMPKNCADCNMTTCKGEDVPWNYVCSINLKDIDFNETDRAEHCPLVEIVTCKDCKYFKRLTCRGGQCVSPTKTYINETTNDFYCVDGERR